MPPAGSQPLVDTQVSLFDCQIASVGCELRRVVTIATPPGWIGSGGSTNGETTPLAFSSATAVRLTFISPADPANAKYAGTLVWTAGSSAGSSY